MVQAGQSRVLSFCDTGAVSADIVYFRAWFLK